MPMIPIKLERQDGLVRVVRCKDCKYMVNAPELDTYCTKWSEYFEYWEDITKPFDMNGFCHMGERRTEDE